MLALLLSAKETFVTINGYHCGSMSGASVIVVGVSIFVYLRRKRVKHV